MLAKLSAAGGQIVIEACAGDCRAAQQLIHCAEMLPVNHRHDAIFSVS